MDPVTVQWAILSIGALLASAICYGIGEKIGNNMGRRRINAQAAALARAQGYRGNRQLQTSVDGMHAFKIWRIAGKYNHKPATISVVFSALVYASTFHNIPVILVAVALLNMIIAAWLFSYSWKLESVAF
jgi:hypothetical protein